MKRRRIARGALSDSENDVHKASIEQDYGGSWHHFEAAPLLDEFESEVEEMLHLGSGYWSIREEQSPCNGLDAPHGGKDRFHRNFNTPFT